MADFGKREYERMNSAKRTPRIRVRPQTTQQGLAAGIKRAVEALETAGRVEVAVHMRGAEKADLDTARATLDKIVVALVPESGILVDGPIADGPLIICAIEAIPTATDDTSGAG